MTDPQTGASDVPELLPARMLNEYAYCPRLFYLEWVQQEFADSADAVEGRLDHRRVDRTEGEVPLPTDDMDGEDGPSDGGAGGLAQDPGEEVRSLKTSPRGPSPPMPWPRSPTTCT